MAELKITKQRWRLLYPYRVEWADAYKRYNISQSSNDGRGRGPRHFYVIRPEIQEYIDALPPARFLGIKRKAVLYVRETRQMISGFMANKAKIYVTPLPPALYMARKSDILMLKLTHGGR